MSNQDSLSSFSSTQESTPADTQKEQNKMVDEEIEGEEEEEIKSSENVEEQKEKEKEELFLEDTDYRKPKEEEKEVNILEFEQKFRILDETDLSTHNIAKISSFSYKNFQKYRFKDFTTPELLEIIINLGKKYDVQTYINKIDLKKLDEWRVKAYDEIEKLSYNCSNNELKRIEGKPVDQNFTFSSENRKYQNLKSLISKIDNLCIKHEGSKVIVSKDLFKDDDLSEEALLKDYSNNKKIKNKKVTSEFSKKSRKMKLLNQRRQKRLEEENQREGRNKRDFERLKNQKPIYQLKYFIRIYGPLSGIKKYNEWNQAKQFAEKTTSLKDHVDKNLTISDKYKELPMFLDDDLDLEDI